jgi:predicted DNA-binding transcriptional regulator AlpA
MTDLNRPNHPYNIARPQFVAEGDPDGFLKPEEVAQLADVCLGTLENWRKWERWGPRMYRYPRGGTLIWLRSFIAEPQLTETAQQQRFHLDRRAGDLAQWIAEGDPDGFLKPEKVVQLTGVCEQTLESWRKKRIGPPWFRLGPRMVRHRRSELVAWLRSRSARPEVPKSKSSERPAAEKATCNKSKVPQPR